MPTLGTKENGHCKEVAVVERLLNIKSQCMEFLFAGTKKSGHCRAVAVSGVPGLYCTKFVAQGGNKMEEGGGKKRKSLFSRHFHTTQKRGCISGISILGFVDRQFVFSHPPLSHRLV